MTQSPDREKALELAIAQIDKNYGKGSVMRLGDEVRQPISVIPTARSPWTWRSGSVGCRAAGWSRSTARSPRVRPPSHCTRWPTPRPPVASRRSSTPSTHWIRSTPRSSAWTPTRCWCPSPTPVSRRWRSPTCWFARARWTSWSSTRWPRWCHGRRSRARWGTATSVCRPG